MEGGLLIQIQYVQKSGKGGGNGTHHQIAGVQIFVIGAAEANLSTIFPGDPQTDRISAGIVRDEQKVPADGAVLPHIVAGGI